MPPIFECGGTSRDQRSGDGSLIRLGITIDMYPGVPIFDIGQWYSWKFLESGRKYISTGIQRRMSLSLSCEARLG